jgi:hypothetical protein
MDEYLRENKKCRRVVRNFLETRRFPVSENKEFNPIGDALATYLSESGFNRWVIDGMDIGGAVRNILLDFEEDGECFNSVKGRIGIRERYGGHGFGYYEAYFLK